MATGNSHFKLAPDAPKGNSSGPEMPVDSFFLMGIVTAIGVVFLVAVIWYWRKINQNEAS